MEKKKSIRKPKAILFDLDDTILACAKGDRLLLWQEACENFAMQIPEMELNLLFDTIQKEGSKFWNDPNRESMGKMDMETARQNIVIKAFSLLGIANKSAAKELASYYHKRREFDIEPFPGALETLKFLNDNRFILGLITNGNSDIQRFKIEKYKLGKYFKTILIEGEFGVGKPDPSIFLQALKDLKVAASDTWMVGDNPKWEIDPAQKLGMVGVWNDFRKQGLEEGATIHPDIIINSIAEIQELI